MVENQMNKKVGIKVIVGMVLCLLFLLCGKNMWNIGMLDVYAETDATGQWEYVIWNVGDDDVWITGYLGKDTVIEVPSKVDGYIVSGIDNFAFADCSALTSITLPESLVSISTGAFENCSGLTSITIPKNVNSFGINVFTGCNSLASIVVDEENKVFDSRDNCNAIIETSSKKLLYGCKNTVIPKSVTSINEDAFSECSGLTSITIPDTVTSIGENAFGECSGLKSIVISDSVKKIGTGAFSGCSSLTSITIPEGITEIKWSVFYGCRNIKSIYIPAKVKKIEGSAFANCTSLTKIVVDKNNKFYDSRNNCNAIIEKSTKTLVTGCKNTVIPKDVKKIGDSAFSGCSGLKSITIPQSVTEIGGRAFDECTGLTSITIPEGVTYIEDQTFYKCKNLKSVTIPKDVETIGNEAFYECSSLKSVTIPQSVKHIGYRAFYKCSSLKSIEIPDSVTEIFFDAFSKIGKHFIIFSSDNSYAKKYAKSYKVKWKNSKSDSIDTFLISIKKTAYTYDGKGKKPTVTVEMGGKKLKKGTDYKVEYENNVKVGTAKAIISGMGNYTGAVTKTFTINPGKVKELKQKSTYFSNAITLTWEKMPGVDGYKVYRATSENGTYVKVATVKKTTYKNTKLEPAKSYYYKVYAYKAKVKGEFSDVIAAGTKTNKPVLNVTAGAGKATLTWEEVDGADRYEVYMKSGKSGKYKKAKTVKAGTTVYTKSKLAKGKNYSFKIRTYRLVSGKKIYSDWSKVKTVKMK